MGEMNMTKFLTGDEVIWKNETPNDSLKESKLVVKHVGTNYLKVKCEGEKHLIRPITEFEISPFNRRLKVGDIVTCVDTKDLRGDEIQEGLNYLVVDTTIIYDKLFVQLEKENGNHTFKYNANRFTLATAKPVKNLENASEELEDTKRYGLADGRQLFDHFEEMFPKEKCQAFYELNVMKYMIRYEQKNQDDDLHKAMIYTKRLRKLLYGVEG